jgi:hypothetical protein
MQNKATRFWVVFWVVTHPGLVLVLVPEIDLVYIPETIRNERTIRTPSLVEPCLHMWLNCKYGSNLTVLSVTRHTQGSTPLYLLSFVFPLCPGLHAFQYSLSRVKRQTRFDHCCVHEYRPTDGKQSKSIDLIIPCRLLHSLSLPSCPPTPWHTDPFVT